MEKADKTKRVLKGVQLLIAFLLLFGIFLPTTAQAAPLSQDRVGRHIRPVMQSVSRAKKTQRSYTTKKKKTVKKAAPKKKAEPQKKTTGTKKTTSKTSVAITTAGLESMPYKLIVSIADQRVYVLSKKGDRVALVKTMKCSTGTVKNPTPLRTFILPQDNSSNVGKWYYFSKYKVYAQYYRRIYQGYLFHSVLFNKRDPKTLVRSSVSNLGRRASHGCIRLSVEDAKWMYENIRGGTRVEIVAPSLKGKM